MKQEQLLDFFVALFEKVQGYIEIRTIKKGKALQSWYSPGGLEGLVKDLTGGLEGYKDTNVYFGVCPRKTKIGREENVNEISALWVDLDCKDEKERVQKLRKLKGFALKPSILVRSGKGFHVYWLLDKVYPVKSEKERLRIKGCIKGLAKALGGDLTAHDLARILRVPGTTNIKDPKKPLPVELSEFRSDHRFKLSDFVEYQLEVKEPVLTEGVQFEAIPPRFYDMLVSNAPLKRIWEGKRSDLKDESRSGYDMALANLLVSSGFSDSETASILRENPQGRGEEGSLTYLSRTIKRARLDWEEGQGGQEVQKEKDRKKEKGNKPKQPGKKTLIPGLINLVKDNGVIKYLLKESNSLVMKETYKDEKGKIWIPKQDLPILYPSKEVLKMSFDLEYSDLLDEVREFILTHVELPSDPDYLYLSLWICHTYLIEKFNTTPIVYLYGVHSTGKTRGGEVLAQLAFRGMMVTAPTPATMFRIAHWFQPSMVLDEIQLWTKDADRDVQNLIKSRYKRGLTVPRQNQDNPDQEDKTEFFNVFAPLVVCTTEHLPDAIQARCLLYLMRPNSNEDVEKEIDEKWAVSLRNKLTIFRAKQFDQELPECARVARRRTQEVLSPLFSTLTILDSTRQKEFKETIKGIEEQRQELVSESLEAEIVRVLTEIIKETKENLVTGKEVMDELNRDRPVRGQVSSTMVGTRIKKLGFKKAPRSGGQKSFWIIDSKKLEPLQLTYGVEKFSLSPKDQVQPEFELEKGEDEEVEK